jgi:hypothetical protein
MIWEEVFVDRRLSNFEILEALSSLMNLEPEYISILTLDEWLDKEKSDNRRVICEITIYYGEFPMRLSLYLRDLSLKPTDTLAAIGELCECLGCRGLIGDDSPNPGSYLLITAPQEHRNVLLEDALDDGIINISKGVS